MTTLRSATSPTESTEPSREIIAERSVQAAVEFVILCGSARVLLDEHRADRYGRCCVCTVCGVHNVRYPCIVAFIAKQALPRTKPSRLK